ncbi:MAG: hypothetical protein NVS2B7_28430 [Herpetosiphon sp.]
MPATPDDATAPDGPPKKPPTGLTVPRVVITTDGSARGNPGPGGWAALLESAAGRTTLLTGRHPKRTTNNAMEVAAVAGAIAALTRPCHVLLRTDSEYVINGLRRILGGGTMAHTRFNRDHWMALETALRPHTVEWEWVRAHAGDPRNEQVDTAANAAANAAADEARSAVGIIDAAGWQIYVTVDGRLHGASWFLSTPQHNLHGHIPRSAGTDLTMLYRALVGALTAAAALPESAAADIIVRSSLETLVKQGAGEWKIRQPAQQEWGNRVAALRPAFAKLSFEHLPSADLKRRIEQIAQS